MRAQGTLNLFDPRSRMRWGDSHTWTLLFSFYFERFPNSLLGMIVYFSRVNSQVNLYFERAVLKQLDFGLRSTFHLTVDALAFTAYIETSLATDRKYRQLGVSFGKTEEKELYSLHSGKIS